MRVAEGEELGSNLLHAIQRSPWGPGGLGGLREWRPPEIAACRARLTYPGAVSRDGGEAKNLPQTRPVDLTERAYHDHPAPRQARTEPLIDPIGKPTPGGQVSGPGGLGSPMMVASSKTFRLRSSTLSAKSKSCRFAIDKTAFST